MNNKILEVRNISKSYVNNNEVINVLNNISFDLYDGEIISIVGTSGCGKSTLLNVISGLDKEYEGDIKFNISENDIGYMFQNDALFPWLNNYQNASFSSKIKNIDKHDYIDELLDRYGLVEFKYKYPKDLSGGMKQRLALIRTISVKPKLLLLDEPFASLDYQNKLLIGNDVYRLVKENNMSLILITHDISEAISLSDRVIVLSNRPSTIKNIYDINLESKSDPISNRKDINFSSYFELIGKDLNLFHEE